ncbi:DUF5683 domain-containing protein [Hymenobacter terricola]|uniref:DUF5683 domain-containing protein n=1 Tax=Hymenobacter terricola TaxID=2819236 RepID=UPI001B311E6E|nr:DUF5683 domain-containing protein [Hymenobacter terricola]
MNRLYSRFAILLALAGWLLAGPAAQAQVFTPTTPTVIRPDTTERREVVVSPQAKRSKAAADSAKRTEHMFRAFGYKGIRLTRPGKAALLAAILPGSGQIYNRAWWKLPLVYGGLGGVIYGEYFYQKGYREFADAYNHITERQDNPVTGAKFKIGDQELGSRAKLSNSVEALNTGVVAYRGSRDIFYLYTGLVYGLQIVDALVDAHLKNFDVSDDLTFHWEPTLMAVPGQASALPTAPGLLFALKVK